MNNLFLEYWLFGIILLTSILILITTFMLQRVLKEILNKAQDKKIVKKSWWERFKGLQPIEKEKELILPHSYDGIQELNNPTPPWFMWLFYLTIIFSGIYVVYYHFSGVGELQVAEYTTTVEEAKIAKDAYLKEFAANINEDNVVALNNKTDIEEGKKIYSTNCIACHGDLGQGGIGPNLTDDYWLHGGEVKDIFKTITNGVPEKGMISWKSSLDPLQIQKVASFILTLKGTNPPSAKEPQGEKI